MSKDLITAKPDVSLKAVAQHMLNKRIDGLPVINDDFKLVGLVTKSHIFRAVVNGFDVDDTSVGSVMATNVVTCSPLTSLEEAWKTAIGRMPVVDECGELVGIVTRSDLVSGFYYQALTTKNQLMAVLNAAHNCIVAVDRQGCIANCNRSAEKAIGLTQEQALGRKVTEVIPDANFMDTLKNKKLHFSKKITIKGRKYFCNISVVENKNEVTGAVIVFEDISDFEAISEELQSTKDLNKQLDTIIESIYDGLIVADGQGIIRRVNSSYEKISGVRKECYLNKHVLQVLKEGYISDTVTNKVLEQKRPVNLIQDLKVGKQVLESSVPVFKEGTDEIEWVVTIIRDLTELNNLNKQLEYLKERYYKESLLQRRSRLRDTLVFCSAEMENIVDYAEKVAVVDSTVLLQGETGVGKEVIAEIVHDCSSRSNQTFVKVNCSAIPDNLIESELFGYEKGSFTGASNNGKVGLFESANKGTLFLDEIGELPLGAQSKLLRVLQEKEIVRVGSVKPAKVDVRIVAATNKDLIEMVEQGKFRQDLYYRLNVIPINIPPLRERKEDIPPLIMSFTKEFNAKYKLSKRISIEALNALQEFNWPGNVRQLRNVVERLVVSLRTDEISLSDIQALVDFEGNGKSAGYVPANSSSDVHFPRLKEAVSTLEKRLLEQAYLEFGSTRKVAAKLGISQPAVVKKMQKYGISPM